MIGKMKSITSNNSINNIKDKYSKKRLNNISNRIRSLEKDINRIKTKDSLVSKKSIDNNMSIVLDKNSNPMISHEKIKPKNKYTISQKSLVKNYLFNNDNKSNNKKYNTNNNSSKKSYKAKIKKEASKSQIYKIINNYNYLIHEKKNSLLKLKPHFNKKKKKKEI
jgi:Ni,Fe-hydrogenase I large subunit